MTFVFSWILVLAYNHRSVVLYQISHSDVTEKHVKKVPQSTSTCLYFLFRYQLLRFLLLVLISPPVSLPDIINQARDKAVSQILMYQRCYNKARAGRKDRLKNTTNTAWKSDIAFKSQRCFYSTDTVQSSPSFKQPGNSPDALLMNLFITGAVEE